MIDLKIISIRDLLPVTGASFLKGMTPVSLELKGDLFNQASEVLINGIPSPEFISLSDSRIIAQVPIGLEGSVINQLAVIAESPSKNRSSLLNFTIGKSIKPLSGIQRLVQLFCKILLQTPGSDKFDPSLGAGLLGLLGQTSSIGGAQSITAAISNAVTKARDQILTLQNNIPRIPPDERLLNASTEAVGFDPNTTTAMARVSLTALSGREAVANLTF